MPAVLQLASLQSGSIKDGETSDVFLDKLNTCPALHTLHLLHRFRNIHIIFRSPCASQFTFVSCHSHAVLHLRHVVVVSDSDSEIQ